MIAILGEIIEALWLFLARFGRLARFFRSLRAWFLNRDWGVWLAFYIVSAVGGIIKKLVAFVGITFVAYTWATPALLHYVAGPLLGLPPDWQSFLAMTRIDDAATVLLSAMVYVMGKKISIQKSTTGNMWA